jgi:predicted acylesterase/phospholipase RssA
VIDAMELGLVLSGGGANGAVEAGVVAATGEAGLRPRVLAGGRVAAPELVAWGT